MFIESYSKKWSHLIENDFYEFIKKFKINFDND